MDEVSERRSSRSSLVLMRRVRPDNLHHQACTGAVLPAVCGDDLGRNGQSRAVNSLTLSPAHRCARAAGRMKNMRRRREIRLTATAAAAPRERLQSRLSTEAEQRLLRGSPSGRRARPKKTALITCGAAGICRDRWDRLLHGSIVPSGFIPAHGPGLCSRRPPSCPQGASVEPHRCACVQQVGGPRACRITPGVLGRGDAFAGFERRRRQTLRVRIKAAVFASRSTSFEDTGGKLGV
ncbi:hypothetical protein [Rhizobium yanglingense]